MKYELLATSRFRKDVKRLQKQGLPMDELFPYLTTCWPEKNYHPGIEIMLYPESIQVFGSAISGRIGF